MRRSLALFGLWFAASFAWPLIAFALQSLHLDGPQGAILPGWTLGSYARLLSSSATRAAFLLTGEVALLTAVITTVLAVPLAYFLVRRAGRRASWWITVLMAPTFVPVVVRSLGWILTLGHILHLPVNDLFSVLVGEVHYHLPLEALLLAGVFQNVPEDLEQAAFGLGATRLSVARRVVWPLVRPGVAAAALIIFSASAAIYTSVVLLGGNRVFTVPVYVFQEFQQQFHYAAGSALAILLLIGVLAINLLTPAERA
jgi:putative spermidine/putrescine transport system permease protein